MQILVGKTGSVNISVVKAMNTWQSGRKLRAATSLCLLLLFALVLNLLFLFLLPFPFVLAGQQAIYQIDCGRNIRVKNYNHVT